MCSLTVLWTLITDKTSLQDFPVSLSFLFTSQDLDISSHTSDLLQKETGWLPSQKNKPIWSLKAVHQTEDNSILWENLGLLLFTQEML